MAKQHIAIVFTKDRPIGSRPDPKQHWHKGELYSHEYLTVETPITLEEKTAELRARWNNPDDPNAEDCMDYFKVLFLEGRPHPDDRWDPTQECFVDVSGLPND